jgi:predicted TIM-barrel fold metal-dependent hydrolase
MYATFFNDAVGAHLLSWWGQDNCMWSNDFPHSNSTWPVSRDVITRDLANLPDETIAKVLHGNCAKLYDLPMP